MLFGLLKRKKVSATSAAAWQAKKRTVRRSQIAVLRAMAAINRPCHYRMISQRMGIMEGSVTPRLAEMRRNGFIKIAYVNVGFNRVRVNYYVITGRGYRYMDEYTDTF